MSVYFISNEEKFLIPKNIIIESGKDNFLYDINFDTNNKILEQILYSDISYEDITYEEIFIIDQLYNILELRERQKTLSNYIYKFI